MLPKLTFSAISHDSPQYAATVALRHAILRQPLGLAFPDDELREEKSHFHLACYADDALAACLVLVAQSESEIKMRQVAVASHFQNRGVGRALVQFAEEFARQRNFSMMTLHARATAVPFYEKLNYQTCGESFEEVSLLHWKMKKSL